MELENKNRFIAVLLCMTAGLGGCTRLDPIGSEHPGVTPDAPAVANRFQEPQASNATLIESAVELSDKYAQLTAKMAELQQLNQDLQQENAQHKRKIEALESQNKQTDAKLEESNSLVMDLNAEL